MPTFTAIALDRLLETGATKSVDKSGPNSRPPFPYSKPIPNSKLERRHSTTTAERKVNRPQMSPALYATPEATPLPDSPSSFPPSPYIINHKRRGPRLLKSFSEHDVSSREKALDGGNVNGNEKHAESNFVESSRDGTVTFTIPDPIQEEHENGIHHSPIKEEHANGMHSGSIQEGHVNGTLDRESGGSYGVANISNMNNGLPRVNDVPKLVPLKLGRNGDSDDFFDPQESMSVTSNTEGEDNAGAESSSKFSTSNVEFFDAWEELSCDSGPPSSAVHDAASELRDIRLSLLMEIEKRKQVEEALNNMQSNWQRIRQQLALLGLPLPANFIDSAEDVLDPAEELCRQLDVARFVSVSVGRGIARAEMEMEMETQIESKNFEIARLLDRLHYYEAVNREMSQRNQAAIEMTRRDRQKRRRRQRWVWGSIAAAITLGTAVLAWSYLPAGKGSSSNNNSSHAPDGDDAAE